MEVSSADKSSALDSRQPPQVVNHPLAVGNPSSVVDSNQRRKHLYSLGKPSEYPGPIKKPVEDPLTRSRPQQVVEGPSSTIKRILLTRRYKDHNIYNDLGIRVVGGKRMPGGELGAFVSAVNQAKYNQILGEVKEGDQVLEWNGVLLNGKTFEEVERIVNSSSGEVEIILKSEGEKSHRFSNLRKYCPNRDQQQLQPHHQRFSSNNVPLAKFSPISRNIWRGTIIAVVPDVSPDRSPPVPIHRRNGHETATFGRQNLTSRIYDNVDGYDLTDENWQSKLQDSLGYLQVAVNFDHATSRIIVRIIAARGLKMRDATRRLAPNPFIVEWQVSPMSLTSLYLEFSVWDYDRLSENNALGQVTVSLAASLDIGYPAIN
ncbi:unnamed protein product [Nippostrongylus brasiliensis]|uniref:Protein piccolo (inferred by orthology to a human protein) n=1 Tax=Nippostrongylus brasiliensis TaxID=27835 RepID=A0A158QXK7_NIPBR|nr:unnamed protein product [Nippostrongylus brasiliensis]